jgi:cytochrome c553
MTGAPARQGGREHLAHTLEMEDTMKKLMTLALLAMATTALAGEKFELKGDKARGEVVFKTFCFTCHGEKGDGNGPAGAALVPKPANFTDAKLMAQADDQYLYDIIKEGGASKQKSPLMVSWKASLTDQQIRDVATYVRAFAPNAVPAKAEKPAKGKKAPKAKK